MRESTAMTMKKKQAMIAELEFSVKAKKNKVGDALDIYRVAAQAVNLDTKKFVAADKAYATISTAKNMAKLDEAKEALLVSVASYQEAGANLNAAIDAVRSAYAELAEYEASPAKVNLECERYCESVDKVVLKIQALTDGVEIPDTPIADIMDNIYNEDSFEEIAEEEEPEYEAPAAPAPAPAAAPAAPAAPAYQAPAYQAPAYQAPAYTYDNSPKVAPVVVDVSAIVEKAIAATMQKFSVAFDRRIEAFIAEHPVNIPMGQAAPVAASGATPSVVSRTYGADEILALESTILDDEKFLIEKLSEMMENLKSLTETMANVSATYAELADKQANVNAVQKQTNDMQRHTLREQQGIQVSQRVIAQDQIAVAQDQALLTDQQTAIKDSQSGVTEAQAALAETQRVVMENQATLEKAMNSVMKTQKDLITAQQAVIAGNSKNVEMQKEITDKQAETLELQKDALAAQKQMMRDQKSANAKQKELGAKKPAKKDESETPADNTEA